MKRKGFTLIELLAVIVILAVIALIAVPLILGVIEKAKKGAIKETVNGYLESIQNTVAIQSLDSLYGFNNTTCILNKNTMTCDNGTNFEVNVKGDKLDKLNVMLSEKGIVERAEFRKDRYCGNYRRNVGIHFVDCNYIDASEVSFTPSDNSWNVSTVEEALDSLRRMVR